MTNFKTSEHILKLNNLLSEEERKLIQSQSEPSLPPIFIVGAPRSGTTLLYQILVSAFNISYIDNIVAKFWEAPTFGLALSNEIVPYSERVMTDFSSEFGFTKGPTGPHEFGYFWKRWFSYTDVHELSEEQIKSIDSDILKKEVSALIEILGIPIAFKNAVAVTLQAKLLAQIFSNGIFLFVKRDPLFNAQSLLQSRLKLGNINNWFSAKPKEYRNLKNKNFAEQVIGQVFYCNQRINETKDFLKQLGNTNHFYIDINYEKLCESPNATVEKINNVFSKLNIKRKNTKFEKFRNTNQIKIDSNYFEELKKAFNNLY